MTSQNVDPFGRLLEVIDRRMALFGPDRSGMMGFYDGSTVLLDTGQLVPNPVITKGVTPGHRYPCVWMQDGHDVCVISVATGVVWAITDFAFGDMHWASDGTEQSGLLTPPDTDAYDSADLGVSHAWYSGGSDGVNIYHLAIGASGQWHVDKFDGDLTTLLDRWTVTGYTAAFGGNTYDAFFDIQHVTANADVVCVLADVTDSSLDHIEIALSVFDTSGSLLHQHTHATPGDHDGPRARIQDPTGSCTDGANVYFQFTDIDFNIWFAAWGLSSGTLDLLVMQADLEAQVPDATFGFGTMYGLVEKDGDLISATTYGVVRFTQGGVVVWWAPITNPAQDYGALAHSGRGSVYADFLGALGADEFDVDTGAFVQHITTPETNIMSWLVGTP